jgi:hypothetical protein
MKVKLTLGELLTAITGEDDRRAFELLMKAGATLKCQAGTHELRVAGVAGTATSGSEAALAGSWRRAARRKLGLPAS